MNGPPVIIADLNSHNDTALPSDWSKLAFPVVVFAFKRQPRRPRTPLIIRLCNTWYLVSGSASTYV